MIPYAFAYIVMSKSHAFSLIIYLHFNMGLSAVRSPWQPINEHPMRVYQWDVESCLILKNVVNPQATDWGHSDARGIFFYHSPMVVYSIPQIFHDCQSTSSI